jgi:outer membrane protein OmpA-like peptidoglycan-associated protein
VSAATSHTGRRSRRLLSSPLLVASLVAAASAPWSVGCSGDDPSSGRDTVGSAISAPPGAPAPTTPATSTTPAATNDATTAPDEAVPATEPAATEPTPVATDVASSTDSAAPAPVTDPLDDLDEDGLRDERCGTVDLGAGLVVETLCNTELVPAPEDGVVATAGSLLLLPSPTRWDDLADVDATIRTATTPDGRRVVIYVLGSDTLFDTGSADVRSTATPPLAAIAASITARFPDATIAVRGAADSVGEPAANQSLSERRATAVAGALAALGIDPARLTAIGLGEDHPVAEEQLPDGSVSDIGRQVNRRVEIVVG